MTSEEAKAGIKLIKSFHNFNQDIYSDYDYNAKLVKALVGCGSTNCICISKQELDDLEKTCHDLELTFKITKADYDKHFYMVSVSV